MRLLLVEDKPAVQTTLQRSLARREMQEVVCGDGARALEPIEAEKHSRMDFKLTGFDGQIVTGFPDLPAARNDSAETQLRAALVSICDDHHRSVPVGMAVLLQPAAGLGGQGMATTQVAQTQALRRTLARRMLGDTLWLLMLLVLLVLPIAFVVVAVMQRATRPVREPSARLGKRAASELSPHDPADGPRELPAMIAAATHGVMQCLSLLLDHPPAGGRLALRMHAIVELPLSRDGAA